jgi:alpha-L-fucosidase
VPSPEQATYQHTEMTAFLHFSLATFDGTEQGNTADKPTVFAPTNLTQDTVNSWVSDLKAAGFRQAMLVAKHSIGFCLWPSKSTNDCNQYSVAESAWPLGQSGGDLVQMWATAMNAAGMRVAIYLAPWDQHYSGSSYLSYYDDQLTDVLTNYGPVYELELDGNNAPTINWSTFYATAKKLQPHILIWAGPQVAQMAAGDSPAAATDLQWIGNENGQASRTTSSRDLTNCGGSVPGGSGWCAWETNVSDRLPDGDHWFWHPGETPMALSEMQSIYFSSVGMNSTLIFNVPPSNTGAFDPNDAALLQQFGTWYSALYVNNTLKGQPVTADSTWATAGFDGSKAVDEDVCTYWAAAEGKTTARLEVDPASSITFSVISIREPIELGERSTGYHVEIKQNGSWTTPKDSSGNQVKGTVIGQRQLWQLGKTTADGIALVIDSARGVPAISEFGAYNP